MEVWKIGDDAARKLSGIAKQLHRDAASRAILITAATRDHHRLHGDAGVEPFALAPAQWDSVRDRLIEARAARLSDPLPAVVREEAHLILYTHPALTIEYMGRGRLANDVHLPTDKANLFSLDRAGGRRTYLFRRMASGPVDARLSGMNERFDGYREWLTDPDARLVVSIGGGGFRMFAATSVLRALDDLLGGNRARVSEVWGSSGGAFIGYVYASGFQPTVIDQLGYDLYHGRHPHLTDGSAGSLIRANLRALVRKTLGRRIDPEMAAWLEELDRKEPPATRTQVRLPFYPVAANPHRGGALSALAAPEHIPEDCTDFILPCNPRDAVAASTSVPGLLAAQKNITGAMSPDQDTWIDGSVTDENPLVLPYVKWSRERKRAPDTTPPVLKLLLINLNLRTSESSAVRLVQSLPLVKRLEALHQVPRLLDMLLDSKTNASIMLLTETGKVELMTLKLTLGTLSANNPRDIPNTIRAGRSLEAWQIATYRRGL